MELSEQDNQKLADVLCKALPEVDELPSKELSRLYAELSKLNWDTEMQDALADAAIYCMKDATETNDDERRSIAQRMER